MEQKRVSGQRSPRWALWSKMVIPCENGQVYLVRRRVVQTPLFGLYLHNLEAPDKEDPHDHPWPFLSFIVRGGYLEDFYPYPWVCKTKVVPFMREQNWKRFSLHRMRTGSAHRIKSVQPGTISLILVGRRQRNWGFFTKEGWVQWDQYENPNRGPAVEQRSSR